ncbi:MAG TPA: hypothetical protein PK358_00815 [Spirochaetota bacterium]|nr:hypothetical protein [Spirochaetota bacterium]HPJ33342.1 hypothetical protein [Spirochaetota bacterium]
MTFKKFLILPLLLLIIFYSQAYPQRTKSSQYAGSQRHAQRSLKDSRYFFHFIDPSISNKGTDEEKSIYIEAIRRDIISRTLYLKFSFNSSLIEIKKTQNLLIDLFKKVIERDRKEALSMLNEIAPEILDSGDAAAKKYISLGYRCAKWAEKVSMMSDNLPPTNYSIRIYEYVKAIKNAKYARRYAIIALIEKRLPPEKKRRTNYNRYKIVEELINTYLTDKKDFYLKIHMDNFYKKESSIYDNIISNPELEKIPEYLDYKKDN